jgi:hypothetical protein
LLFAAKHYLQRVDMEGRYSGLMRWPADLHAAPPGEALNSSMYICTAPDKMVKVTSTLLRPAYVSNLRVLAIHGPMASPVLIRQIVQTALWYTATGKR